MEREIKFRAKALTGEWVYGLYYTTSNESKKIIHLIRSYNTDKIGFTDYEIDINTLGQFTGLKDCNDKEAYEKDIAYITYLHWSEKCICKFKHGSFIFRCISKNDTQNTIISCVELSNPMYQIKVIGNTIDNPELLKDA